MNRILTVVLPMSIALIVTVGCAGAAPTPTATPEEETMAGMEQKMDEAGMEHGMEAHQEAHDGQVGMAMNALKSGADFHLEIVSDAPGQYTLYLSDNNREPVSPEGYTGSIAVIRPDGSEIAKMPFMVMGDHLKAEGGPTDDVSQLDVRLTVEGPDLVDIVEMDFTLLYED